MYKILLSAVMLIAPGSTSFGEQPLNHYVETITIDDFMKLPFDFQVMYVAGITDGFTYVMRNYNVPGYDEYSACIRVSLKAATEDMIEQIKQRQKKEDEPLMTYFAKSLGARCHQK
jgi:hypothetical protein